MNKADLIGTIAQELNIPKATVNKVLSAYHKTVQAALATGERVQITGFGTFQTTETKERSVRNPQTGKAIIIAAAKKPKFKPGKALKESLA